MSYDGAGQADFGDLFLCVANQSGQLCERNTDICDHRIPLREYAHCRPQSLFTVLPELLRFSFTEKKIAIIIMITLLSLL